MVTAACRVALLGAAAAATTAAGVLVTPAPREGTATRVRQLGPPALVTTKLTAPPPLTAVGDVGTATAPELLLLLVPLSDGAAVCGAAAAAGTGASCGFTTAVLMPPPGRLVGRTNRGRRSCSGHGQQNCAGLGT